MLCRVLISAAVGAALLFSGQAHAKDSRSGYVHRVALVLHDGVALRAAPDWRSAILTTLVEQSQVTVTGRRGAWSRASIWAGVNGWLPSVEVTYRRPWESVSTYHAPALRARPRHFGPVPLHQPAVATATTALTRSPGGATVRRLFGGQTMAVDSWMQDSQGSVWYRIGRFWARGDAIQFSWPPHAGNASHLVAGKGMWLTLGPITAATPAVILDSAQRAGITHLYLEAAISPLGFHGRRDVGPLIDAAYRRRIAVIAWVYPYLGDIAADVALTRKVAAFRTAEGHGFNGIAADLENNVSLDTVRAYSQLVRAYLGPLFPLVGVTYPPQSTPSYPFAEVAHNYDVIAPMDYWHETRSGTGPDYPQLPYGWQYGYRYAVDSITRIRVQAPRAVVAPIGQVFDDFGRLEMGPYAPSSHEVDGFMAGSKATAAVGVSFFQWMTATADEWRVIRQFSY
jgi:hypothetical protein